LGLRLAVIERQARAGRMAEPLQIPHRGSFMSLAAFLQQLDQLLEEASSAFQSSADKGVLEETRIEYLGAKSGRLKGVQKQLGNIPGAEKPAAGKRFNEVKQAIEAAFQAAIERLEQHDQQAAGASLHQFDPTLPGTPFRMGRLHPITQTIEELKDIMGRLGFTAADGPEIEDEWHNFQALNIPLDHPARDPLENFYLSVSARQDLAPGPSQAKGSDALLLRSQTSTVQIRVMETTPPPIRIISLGRVYRPDEVDATHYPMFHQMEGLYVDRSVTMADLKSVLRLFATSYLGRDVHIRFRPSFFPFTEPSVEVDFQWGDGWIEFGGAGMVDPAVLSAVGYDPEEVTGFAFGLGVERLCMRRHHITDIRELYKNDVRFLRQF
jgi:phenylalanyl-tRNA synthetase alpha chain